ncbi:TonB-dependent siderophore receptor [Sphingomonas sp.]|uniref:TonB-dependent receptor n=1 Tax=Sphingomonas sp. TaxID=28214 RepID=UPI00286E1D0F|nr:TonB-dependent siderophore receptor [Sphingomonas sp.]
MATPTPRIAAFLLLATTAAPALAQAAPADPAPSIDGVELADASEVIVVTGQREEYGVRTTATATKTDTPVKDIPQALTVISESQIEDQQLRSIADLLYFVPGATPGTGEANRDQFTLRGNNTTADLFVDGIRDDVQYFRDLYNVDRVEVLRGSNAMIFGRGGGGGIVNRVTKRSTAGPMREFALSAASDGGIRLTGDVAQPLSSAVGLRVNAMYEDGDSFRRHVDLERYGINPTLGIVAGPNTRIDVSFEHFHDRRTTDRGVPSRDGRPIGGFDRVFFGDPELSFSRADVNLGTLAIEHQLADGLTLRNRTLVADYDKFYQNIYPSRLDGDEVVLGAYNSRNDRTNLFNQTDLIWTNRLGGVDQTILLGVEVGRQKSRNLRKSGTFFLGDDRVPLTDPTTDADVSFAPSASDANNRTRATIAALYVQDQLRISPQFEIVAGVRFDSFTLKVDDLRATGAKFERSDTLLSPRLGVIFKPRPNLSLYASFSRSFLPQSGDQFSGLTAVTGQLKPERFDNYEVGAKWEPVAGLLATGAVYQLDRTNTQSRDDQDRIVLTGAQRSRGIELGLERSVSDRWQVSAGYALQDAEITDSTSAAPAGRKVPLVPRHSLSLWNRYDVTHKLGLGLGVVARTRSYASISNQVKLPGYTRVDVAGFYKLAKGVEAQVNVENIFGADYFPTAHNDNNIAPGAPTTARASLRFGF